MNDMFTRTQIIAQYISRYTAPATTREKLNNSTQINHEKKSSLGVVFLMSIFVNSICLACIVVMLCVFVAPYVCIAVLTLDAGLLARSQYSEGPATGHLDTGFSGFPCVYKRMLRWFPSFQVATTFLSCSPPDLNFLVTFFHICVHVK